MTVLWKPQKEPLGESVWKGRALLADFRFSEFRDDPDWIRCAAYVGWESHYFPKGNDGLMRSRIADLLQKGSLERQAKLFEHVVSPLEKNQPWSNGSKASSELESLSGLSGPSQFSSDVTQLSDGLSPIKSIDGAISRLVQQLDEVDVETRRIVLKHLTAWSNPLSASAVDTLKQLALNEGELQLHALLIAGRKIKKEDPDRDAIVDQLIVHLEQPSENAAESINAAMSLGFAVRDGFDKQQMQRLLDVVSDDASS